MDLREALYTTRAMRRVTDQPIPTDVQARILDAAVRAPSGSNSQQWRFLLVDDPAVRARIAPLYRDCRDWLWETGYSGKIAAAAADPSSAKSKAFLRMKASVDDAAEAFERYPLLLFAFYRGDGGSIFPAVWSAMLAARGDGVGTSLTTILRQRGPQVLAALGVPEDADWEMACCVTFGYPTGRWGVPERVPAEDVSYANQWGQPLGFEVNGPLWP